MSPANGVNAVNRAEASQESVSLLSPSMSVVIPTYNRLPLLRRLIEQLARQTLSPGCYEVIVVDDGSSEAVEPHLAASGSRFSLRFVTQRNAGAAAARHRGALMARGQVLVFIDDDMQAPPQLLDEHWKLHPANEHSVVLGQIRRDPGARSMPVFERWHASLLDRLAADFAAGRVRPRGLHLYTGNVSLRRDDYFAAGGFDSSLAQGEDSDLGLRLERRGVTFSFSPEAYTLHGSDRTRADAWLKRARLLGACDHRIARKHPQFPEANPWRFLWELSPLARPCLCAAVIAPGASQWIPRLALAAGEGIDRHGLEKTAILAVKVAYATEYFRGVRSEAGSTFASLREAVGCFVELHMPRRLRAALQGLISDVRKDHGALVNNQAKYGRPATATQSLPRNLVGNVGFQMLSAYRLMRALRRARQPLAAKVLSRLMRHAYGSDIHWESEIAPGVTLVHGMGMAISGGARVESGCVLFQHVTLGIGTDPETGKIGAPVVEANVHLGPGATAFGPITIGSGSKVMAGAVVTRSVPPRSVVRPSPAGVEPRRFGVSGVVPVGQSPQADKREPGLVH